jgi:DNA-binding NtrC family response regulator
MSDQARLLVVEDDDLVGKNLALLLGKEGHQATWVTSGEAALATLEKREFDLVISDVRMDGMSGLDLLKTLRARLPDLPVVLLTAHGTVEMAVEAMRDGAADFLVKPATREQLLFVVQRTLAKTAAVRAAPPRVDSTPAAGDDGLVGASPAFAEARALIRKTAPFDVTTLVLGETGTGKELVARALHALSPRAKKPFVAVNCGAIPRELVESELFGYEAGAFTGAKTRKPGRVELAKGGTLFLDEVGDLPLEAQVKLLRLLQENEYEPVGGTAVLKADVRVVLATHRDLKALVREGKFRQDLLERIKGFDIVLPPLRDRRDDIEPLTRHFLASLGARLGRPAPSITAEALAVLRAQDWEGNVRELQKFLERLLVMAPPGDLDADVVRQELERFGVSSGALKPAGGDGESLEERRRLAERAAVEDALAKAKGNRSVAARLLGVSRRTLYNKLEALSLTEA